MKSKLLTSILINVALILLPLIPKPELILNYKILLIICGSIMIWLTQPIFSLKETKNFKSSDRLSVLMILIASFISVIFPVTLWAYSNTDKSGFTSSTLIGIILIVIGIIIRAWSVNLLGIYFTPTVQIQQKHKLITSGPYKWIRHPSYTGAFLAITSGALVLNTTIGYAIAVAAMGFCYSIRISIEEKELEKYFGNQYIEYKMRTKKMIPFIL